MTYMTFDSTFTTTTSTTNNSSLRQKIGVAGVITLLLGVASHFSSKSWLRSDSNHPVNAGALSGTGDRLKAYRSGSKRLTKTEFKSLYLNQPPPPLPPPPPPVQDNCEVLDILSPLYNNPVTSTDDEPKYNGRGIIYSAGSLRPSGNKDGTFTVGPAIGAQFETYLTTDPFDLTDNYSHYIGGMLLLDPVVTANGITSYDSSISYTIYSWYQFDPDVSNVIIDINPPQSPVTGGTGNYLCASGSYNYGVFENLGFERPFFNITGTENKFGIFTFGRLIICNTCQPFSPFLEKE